MLHAQYVTVAARWIHCGAKSFEIRNYVFTPVHHDAALLTASWSESREAERCKLGKCSAPVSWLPNCQLLSGTSLQRVSASCPLDNLA